MQTNLPPEPPTVEPASILVVDDTRANSLARHGVTVAKDYASDLTEVTASKHKVLQILIHLIRNAQQACSAAPAGERRLTLAARASRGGQWVQLEVQDNGVGPLGGNDGRGASGQQAILGANRGANFRSAPLWRGEHRIELPASRSWLLTPINRVCRVSFRPP